MLRPILLVLTCYAFFTKAIIVQPEWKIYYDLRTNKSIDTIDTSNPRQQLKWQLKQLRIGFGPVPCSCDGLTCGCCAGMNISMLNFNHRACMNFSYVPMEFAINMEMLMDEGSVFNRSISAKNPPPACMPVPLPPIVPHVDFCLRFFNIHTSGYNIFTCVDFETRIERAPILVLHFDCMELGQDGVSLHKPDEEMPMIEESGGETASENQEDEQIEIYDEVLEEKNATISQPNKSLIQKEIEQGEVKKGDEIYDEVVEDEQKLTQYYKQNTLATTETTTTTQGKQHEIISEN